MKQKKNVCCTSLTPLAALKWKNVLEAQLCLSGHKPKGHVNTLSSMTGARLATAVAHLDCGDVSPCRGLTGHVTSVTTNKEVSEEEKWGKCGTSCYPTWLFIGHGSSLNNKSHSSKRWLMAADSNNRHSPGFGSRSSSGPGTLLHHSM